MHFKDNVNIDIIQMIAYSNTLGIPTANKIQRKISTLFLIISHIERNIAVCK